MKRPETGSLRSISVQLLQARISGSNEKVPNNRALFVSSQMNLLTFVNILKPRAFRRQELRGSIEQNNRVRAISRQTDGPFSNTDDPSAWDGAAGVFRSQVQSAALLTSSPHNSSRRFVARVSAIR